MYEEKDKDRLDDLRRRLYARAGEGKRDRFTLSDQKKDIPTSWAKKITKPISQIKLARKKSATPAVDQVKTASEPVTKPVTEPETVATDPIVTQATNMSIKKKSRRHSYRIKLLLAGIFFFVVAVGVSSMFIIFGGSAISGDNIAIDINGPFTIGGGEIMSLQIGVTNQNTIPIESATLIIEYPNGTQSADEEGRELYVERLPLDVIASGEAVNIPVRAQVFGEENTEQTIHASVEYRVKGSNATFFKKADPLVFKISSSPVVISVDAVKNIASGQETDIELTITSNSSEKVTDLLVKAEYPQGFDFTSSSPAPVSGQNIWTIDELEPEGSVTILIKGILLGSESEARNTHFLVGVPNERDSFTLASVFSVANHEFVIEEQFLNVELSINGEEDGTAVGKSDAQSTIVVEITNTLEHTIYDGQVTLFLSGNMLSTTRIQTNEGHYDSNTKSVIWDVPSTLSLKQIVPGQSVRFTVSLYPEVGSLLTPQLTVDAKVKARRLSESASQEEISGSVRSVLRLSGDVDLRSEVGYNVVGFNDSGPVPPVAEETTTYSITLMAEASTNDASNVAVNATVPSYVTWMDETTGDGIFAYNPSTRSLEWTVGSLDANERALGSFQVSILPSTSQIGKTPTLIGEQRLKAEDDFTDAVLRDSESALTTQMSLEAGYESDNGIVRAE